MRKFFTLISMLALCVGMSAQTQTSLIEAYQIYPTAENGLQGSDAQIYLNMKNRNAINMWECTLVLPEGVTFQSATLLTARIPEGFNPEFSAVDNGDGTVSFTCEGEVGVGIPGPDGDIATVDIDGRITGISEGTTKITFTTSDGKFSKTCKVNVISSSRSTYSWIIIFIETTIIVFIVIFFIISYRRFRINKEREEGVLPPVKKRDSK